MRQPARSGARDRLHALVIAVLGLIAIAIVAGLYLERQWRSHFDLPPGFDVPQYLLRTRIAMDRGLHSLIAAFPSPFQANPDRPGFPAFAAILHGSTRVPLIRLEYVLPAVGAVVVGMAAGGFALGALRESRWTLPAYVIAVGASVNVAATVMGHFDNILVDAMCLGAATAALRVAEGETGMAALALFVAASVVTHWMFAILFVAILAGLLIVLAAPVVASGTGVRNTPVSRLATALGVSVAAGAGGWLLVPGFQALPVVTGGQTGYVAAAARAYRLPVLGALAAGGAGRLARRRSRPALALLLIWSSAGVGALVVLLAGGQVPAARVWPFALAVPILATAGVVGLTRAGRARLGRVGLALGVVLVLAALAGQAFLQHQTWRKESPILTDQAFAQAGTVGRYLDRIGGTRPVVVAVDPVGSAAAHIRIAFRWIRAAVPIDQEQRVFVYLGTFASLLEDRPEIRPGATAFNKVSRQYWPEVRAAARMRPVVLVASHFSRGYDRVAAEHPGWEVAPGLSVARGPRPRGIAPAPLPTGPSNGSLVLAFVLALLAITAIGTGWSLALLSGTVLPRIALAPAFGVTVAPLAGLVADRIGVRLSPGAALGVGIVAMVAGWMAFVVRSTDGIRLHSRPARAGP